MSTATPRDSEWHAFVVMHYAFTPCFYRVNFRDTPTGAMVLRRLNDIRRAPERGEREIEFGYFVAERVSSRGTLPRPEPDFVQRFDLKPLLPHLDDFTRHWTRCKAQFGGGNDGDDDDGGDAVLRPGKSLVFPDDIPHTLHFVAQF